MNQLSAQVLRAGEILGWVRSFVKKRPPQTTALDINALVRETVGLVSYERCNQDFSIELALADSLPSVEADKIEVQQILLNLTRNSMEAMRSEEHTSELQSLMRISYAVFCLKKNNTIK